MKLPIIINDLIPAGYQDQLEEDFLRVEFPWWYTDDVTYKGYGTNSGLVHVAYDISRNPSDYLPFIKPLIYSLEKAVDKRMEKLLRIRIGFLTPTSNASYSHNAPHVDFLYPHYTACYYINDSDGDTIMFGETIKDMGLNINDQVLRDFTLDTNFNEVARCSPKKGTAFIMDGRHFHASTNPTHNKRRLVVTVNWI
jgi:hypothetical protein